MVAEAGTEPGATTSTDRLVYTLFLATLFHGVLIMGVSFRADPPRSGAAPLEVVLVADTAELAEPTRSRYLATANRRAIGDDASDEAAAARLSEWSPMDNPGLADSESPFQTDPGEPVTSADVLVTQSTSDQRVSSVVDPTTQPNRLSLQARLMRETPNSSIEMEGAEEVRARGEEARELTVSVATREAVVAEYLQSWKRKIEQMGTLHFPDAARHEGLSGSPVLEVAVSADGGLREIRVVRPSGHKVLDQAALRILRLAAPFDPFPEPVRAEYDVLRFIYEWQFIGGAPTTGRMALPQGQ